MAFHSASLSTSENLGADRNSEEIIGINDWEILDVDPVYFGQIIGRCGKTVKHLQSTLQLEIRIKKDTKTLKVRGSEDGKRKFKDWLEKLKGENESWERWDVDPIYFSQIIGRGGKNIKVLQRTFKLQIRIKKDTLQVRGSEDGQIKFKGWLERLPNTTWDVVEFVESKHVGLIIGKNGANKFDDLKVYMGRKWCPDAESRSFLAV